MTGSPITAKRLSEVIEHFGSVDEAIHTRLFEAVRKEAGDEVEIVKTQKLSGQVLNVQTGALRDSIHAEVEDEPGSITGIVGTDLNYAAIHEYGGTIDHPGGTPYFVSKAGGLAVFVHKGTEFAQDLPVTRPHQIPMPERSYLRSTLAEREAIIRERLTAAVTGTLNP